MTHDPDCDLDEDCRCPEADQPKLQLTVHDMIVTPRTVTLDRHCPGCGADLLGEGTLRHYEFQLHERPVDVEEGGGDSEGELVIDWGDWLPEQVDGDWALEWQCAQCDHLLAAADSKVVTE